MKAIVEELRYSNRVAADGKPYDAHEYGYTLSIKTAKRLLEPGQVIDIAWATTTAIEDNYEQTCLNDRVEWLEHEMAKLKRFSHGHGGYQPCHTCHGSINPPPRKT